MNKSRLFLIATLIVAMLGAAFPALANSNCDANINYGALGTTQYGQGEYTLAIESFTCLIERYPESASAYNLRGNAYRKTANYEQAIADYSQAIELDENYAIAYNNRGWTYYNLGDHDLALDDYNRALEIDPNLAYALNNRGLIYQFAGHTQQAADDFSQAIRLGLDTNWAQYNLRLIEASDVPETAEITPVNAPASPQSTVESLLNAAHDLYDQRDFAGAIREYSRVLELDPNNACAYYYRGRSYIATDDFNGAASDFNRLVELVPDFTYGYWERAVAYAHLNRFEEASADAEFAAEAIPDHVNNFIAFGTIAALSGDHAEAGWQFTTLMEMWGEEFITHDAIESGQTITVEMSRGLVYSIPFTAEEGQLVTIHVRSSQADPIIAILDPAGNPIAGDDDSGTGLDSHICQFLLDADGTYWLMVSHAGGGFYGSVEVSVTLE